MRRLLLFMVFILGLTMCCSSLAAEYTDAPNTSTEDVVISIESPWLDDSGELYGLSILPPDGLTVTTVLDIFNFVVDENNRPARYFPEVTQEQIVDILDGGDPDILYMTEFMRMEAEQTDPQANVKTVMLLDVDYQPGQLVVVVLGDTTDPSELVWTALEAEVTAQGQIEFEIPQELVEQLQGEDVLYSLLTVHKGMSRGNVIQRQSTTPVVLPSMQASDTTQNEGMVSASGEPLDEDFELIIVEETVEQIDELAMIRAFVKQQVKPVAQWLPEADREEIQLLLGDDYDLGELVVYDYLALRTINYRDTYGDVITSFSFATPYQEGQKMVSVLGMPKQGENADETQMTWAVQICRVNELGMVEVVFDQLMLIEMGEEPGLLMLLVDPLAL